MAKIKFNKMNKSLSIHKGEQFIGFIDIAEFRKFIFERKHSVGIFKQIDSGNKKDISFSILSDGRLLIEKGLIKIGYINYKEFYEYMCDYVLDIKEFEQM